MDVQQETQILARETLKSFLSLNQKTNLGEERESIAEENDSTRFSVCGRAEVNPLPIGNLWRTPLLSESIFEPEGVGGESTHEQQDEAEKANVARLILLARKYAVGSISPEDTARYEIVSEKVRYMMPRILPQDFDILEATHAKITALVNSTAMRRKKLNLGD